MRSSAIALIAALALPAAACGPTGMSGPTMNNSMADHQLASESVESKDILDRDPRANHTRVKHILISWKDKAAAARGEMGAEAQKRTKREAEKIVRDLLDMLHKGADFDTLMKAKSEDRASAQDGEPYDVSPDAQLVIEFRQLGLRLDVGEIGVVETDYGFHIMKRVE